MGVKLLAFAPTSVGVSGFEIKFVDSYCNSCQICKLNISVATIPDVQKIGFFQRSFRDLHFLRIFSRLYDVKARNFMTNESLF